MVLTRRSRQLESEAVGNDGEKDEKRNSPSHSEKKVEDELPSTDDESNNNNNNKNKKKGNNKKKLTKKKQKEALKSRNTGVGIRISIESSSTERKSTPSNKKHNFDDTNLPSEDNDNDNDREETKSAVVKDNEVDDNDVVEEVQGQVAREEVLEQLKTEEKQSLKSKKKRKRKSKNKSNKTIKSIGKSTQKDDDDNNDDDGEDEELDDNFFAQLDVVRKEEDKKRKELEMMEVRVAGKGKHTTFVFPQNTTKNDNEGMTSEPVKIDENIQVVVLKNPSASTTTMTGVSSSFGTTSTLSKTALIYSRNQLLDGSDSNNANDNGSGGGRKNDSKKRKNNRSGEEIKPWKRAKQQLPLGRSRMKKGGPATFFRKKRKNI